MNALYYAHSGIRYLVLLAALGALVVLLRGLSAGAPYGRGARVWTASFVGLVYLQSVLGLALVFLGFWYPALMGHLTMMLLAAAAAQVLSIWARRAADPRQAHRLGIAGVAVALLLILGGIAAIGRHPFQSRALDAAVAAQR